jgi:hypothetical protein
MRKNQIKKRSRYDTVHVKYNRISQLIPQSKIQSSALGSTWNAIAQKKNEITITM